MNFIRGLVSMNKNRYTEDGFDLDLTYITPRIIAMAFPAEGFESMYRNPLSEVLRLLNSKHEHHYLIVNASDRRYDFSKFNSNVISLPWPNHYPCPLDTFLSAVADVVYYLMQNSKNIVVVHCLAGKGRTGSFIDALLFASGHYHSIEEANDFYQKKRAVKVDYASQMRYLKYFEDIFLNEISQINFKSKVVRSILIQTKQAKFFQDRFFQIGVYDFSKSFELLSEMIIDGNNYKVVSQLGAGHEQNLSSDTKLAYLEVKPKHWANNEAVDILLIMRINGLIQNPKLFRLNFNTLMVDRIISFGIRDLDSVHDLPDDFRITIEFAEIHDREFEEAYRKRFTEINSRLRVIRSRQNKNRFGTRLLYGEDRLKEFSI